MTLLLEGHELGLGRSGPAVPAGGLLPGGLRRDPFGPPRLSALTALREARGQELQRVFWKKIMSEMLVLASSLWTSPHLPVFLALYSSFSVPYSSRSGFRDHTLTCAHMLFDIL